MSDPTPEEVRKSIVAKSDQLNSEDLIAGPITVTVTQVSRGDKKQPINVHIDGGHQVYKPCKSMRRCLIAIWSDDSSKWVGQKLTLFTDPSVVYAGVKVGGLRISHMSGLDNTRTLMLTKTRGEKAEVTILPLKTAPPNNDTRRNEIKKAWAKYAAEHIEGMSPEEKRQQFAAWLTQTIGEYDTGMLDTDGAQYWTVEQFEKCETALKPAVEEESK